MTLQKSPLQWPHEAAIRHLPRGLKWLLAIVVIGGSIVFACIAFFFHWARSNGARMNVATREAVDEGRRFGQAHAQPECVPEALNREDASTDAPFWARSLAGYFLNQCFAMHERDGALCEGVPAPAAAAAAGWSQRCKELGHNNLSCFSTMQGVEGYCNP